jgi:hypothetical protein
VVYLRQNQLVLNKVTLFFEGIFVTSQENLQWSPITKMGLFDTKRWEMQSQNHTEDQPVTV